MKESRLDLFFWPLHLQPFLPVSKNTTNLRTSERIGKNGLYLPMGQHINKKIQTDIVKNIIKRIKKHYEINRFK